MLKACIKKVDDSLTVAHADIPTIDQDVLRQEVISRGFDVSQLREMTSISRIYEWLSIRLLLFEVLHKAYNIVYNSNGKPALEGNNFNISLSHSKNKIALTVNENNPTGVDIQKKSHKLEKLQHKFLHPNELSRKKNYSIEELCIMWSSKEAIYKAFGHPEIFLRQIIIDDFDVTNINASIIGRVEINGMSESYKLHHEYAEDYILAYIVNK